jgi:isopentenyl-diphosphate Delta-isomerase
MTATEYVILVNEQDEKIGTAEKLIAHQQNLLHRAFSIFIFRESGELLIQQRAMHKYHTGGLWTNTCCSHPREDETVIEAGERRLQEELGLSTQLIYVDKFHYNAHFDNELSENEIDHVLLGVIADEAEICIDPKEINATRWISLEALLKELESTPKLFTPWLKEATQVLVDKLQQQI